MSKEKKRSSADLLARILCGLMLSFTVFVFAPIEMWALNTTDFWFRLEDFGLLFVAIFALFFVVFELVFALIRRFLPRAIYLILLATAFGLSLMLYVQGNWLCMVNEVLEGATPEWTRNLLPMLINLVIWFVAVLASICFAAMKPKAFMRVVAVVCALVLVMEGASLSASLLTSDSGDVLSLGEIYTSDEDKLTVSQNGDVLLFMYDTLDTRIMDYVLENYPEYLSELDGFTYYRNNGGLFRKTDPSVVAMLTGKVCKNEEPFYTFANNAFAEDDFLPTLKDNGFTVDIYALPRGLFDERMIGTVDNVTQCDSFISDYSKFILTMMYMVGYRYAPLVTQPFLFRDYDRLFTEVQGYPDGMRKASIADDAGLYKQLQEDGLTIDNDRRFFKFYKMRGAHTPYNVNRDGQHVPDDSVTELDQALGVFTIIGGYLKMLKEQDLYDQSTIIIMADHGRGKESLYCAPSTLIKYPNERSDGEIKVSMAPTSQLDLRATIAHAAGIENYADFGTPMHEWEGVEERERYYYSFEWRMPSGFTFYLNDITEYEIPADATDLANYKKTGNIYTK